MSVMECETPKPFACKAKGCQMSFTNEDHLNVHEKKHEMILNLELENKTTNVFVADQTPTPTRLIKNCEEVGLFDDLKHVNPFDETFRRAINPSSPSNEPDLGNLMVDNHCENSLHTPQVFPNYEREAVENFQEIISEKSSMVLAAINEQKDENTSESRNEKKGTKRKSSSREITRKDRMWSSQQDVIIHRPILLPKVSNFSQQPQIITNNVLPNIVLQHSKPFILPKEDVQMATTNVPIIDKLKATLRINANKISDLKTANRSNKIIQDKGNSSKYIYDNDCMERRRAAAMRYRKKMKKEQMDLRRKNTELIAENNELKKLIKHLKQILASHQNCEVTKAVSRYRLIEIAPNSTRT